MKIWMTGLALGGIAVFSLYSLDESQAKNDQNQEVVEMGKQQQPSGPTEGVKRRWTKRVKPGAPKARRASPSRKKVTKSEESKASKEIVSEEDPENE